MLRFGLLSFVIGWGRLGLLCCWLLLCLVCPLFCRCRCMFRLLLWLWGAALKFVLSALWFLRTIGMCRLQALLKRVQRSSTWTQSWLWRCWKPKLLKPELLMESPSWSWKQIDCSCLLTRFCCLCNMLRRILACLPSWRCKFARKLRLSCYFRLGSQRGFLGDFPK